MPSRQIDIEGCSWSAFPSGQITQYDADEFGVLFVRGAGDSREVRVTRYSPRGTRSREQSLGEMSDVQLRELFTQSQPSTRSPEAGYAP